MLNVLTEVKNISILKKKKYKFINKIFSKDFIINIPTFLIKKIINRFKIYFVPTYLNKLPDMNHPVLHSLAEQTKYFHNFSSTKKQSSLMTCPYLIHSLLMIFEKNKTFNFLDVGGENIDFFLELKKEFKNVKYYVFNQEKVLENLKVLKDEHNLIDFNIVHSSSEIIENNYEFINFGSCIQYFNNYDELLKNIIKVSKNYILVSGTHLYNSEVRELRKHIVAKQVNLFPIILFCYFLNKEFFLDFFIKSGYSVVFEKNNITENVNYRNFYNLFEDIQYTDILFKK